MDYPHSAPTDLVGTVSLIWRTGCSTGLEGHIRVRLGSLFRCGVVDPGIAAQHGAPGAGARASLRLPGIPDRTGERRAFQRTGTVLPLRGVDQDRRVSGCPAGET